MSHTTAIKAVKIQSIGALQSAIAELQSTGIRVELKANATPRAYSHNQAGLGLADYVIVLADAQYDVGLYKQEDGSYEARTDFWRGSVEAILGAKAHKPENAEQAKMGKLFQTYAVHAALEAARRKGLTARRIVKDDGTIQLELTGSSL